MTFKLYSSTARRKNLRHLPPVDMTRFSAGYVRHNDSSAHPSHFIALNLDGHIKVIEISGGDSSKERVYIGPTIFSPNPELVPVTVSFQDVNGDGKPVRRNRHSFR
jgi:hypothetical protein